MRKIIYVFSIAGLFMMSTLVHCVSAAPLLNQVKQEVRQEIPEEKKENLLEKLGSAPGQIIKWLNKRAVISKGTVESVSGTDLAGATFTVTKDGKIYTVTTDTATGFIRRYWGKIGGIGEIQKGHIVTVVGKWTDDERTTLAAINFRDISIQKRNGVFFGTIQSMEGNTWMFATKNRGSQAVTVSTMTRFINKNNETMNQNEIMVGQRVRLKGLWDRTNKTITEVVQVKNFDVPK